MSVLLFVDPFDGLMTTIDTGVPMYACSCTPNVTFEDNKSRCNLCDSYMCRLTLDLETNTFILQEVLLS